MASKITYQQDQDPDARADTVCERNIEDQFIGKLRDLKYINRPDIRDRASLEKNFRQKFETLNRVNLTDAEISRLIDDLVAPDVFKNSVRLREKTTSPATAARPFPTPSSTSATGAKMTSRSSTSFINTNTATTATTSTGRPAALQSSRGWKTSFL